MSKPESPADGVTVPQTVVYDLFRRIIQARDNNVFIERVSASDKEFHFQNWVKSRLDETGFNNEQGGRNSYPDFRLVQVSEGYEIKGLAYPGRWINFDSNSQIPTGLHNGRVIYYVFGRYPAKPDGNSYPVTDLVVCHGDFLNADHEYVHKNKSIRGFGSYGDILIRDRKMYVVPTPFALASNLAHFFTLITPGNLNAPDGFEAIGELVRTEAAELVVGYNFDLRTNELLPEKIPNPNAGREHRFRAWRIANEEGAREVTLNVVMPDILAEAEIDDEN
jgi:hypothetical protein